MNILNALKPFLLLDVIRGFTITFTNMRRHAPKSSWILERACVPAKAGIHVPAGAK